MAEQPYKINPGAGASCRHCYVLLSHTGRQPVTISPDSSMRALRELSKVLS
jgi:hypothetical protein